MASHDCYVQARCLFIVLFILHFLLLKQLADSEVSAIDGVVEAVEALLIEFVDLLTDGTL